MGGAEGLAVVEVVLCAALFDGHDVIGDGGYHGTSLLEAHPAQSTGLT